MSASTTGVPLSEALGFTPDDLTANQAGRLSAAQLERLRQARRRLILIAVPRVALLVLLAAIFLFLAQRNASGILQIVGIGVTLANAALMGVLARNALRLTADMREGQVSVIEGTATHTIRVTGRAANYLIRVDG